MPRRLRFFLLERVVLPLAIVPFKMLVWSWGKIPPDPEVVERVAETPRVILITYHGMFLQLVAFSRLFESAGRRLVVMLSPSLDGRLLAAFLSHFGIDHVRASTGRRAASGSLDLIRRIRRGDIAVIAVDGPRGPCCVANNGFARVAAAAGANVVPTITSSGRGVTFGSWDRARLPLPFARVELAFEPIQGAGDRAAECLLAGALRVRSPVVPPGTTLAQGPRTELEMSSSRTR